MTRILEWYWNLAPNVCMLLAIGLTWIAIGLGAWACCIVGKTADERAQEALRQYMEEHSL